jgi:hypothetical protein
MNNTIKPYRDPVPDRGSIELRRTANGTYSWVITIWKDAIVTDANLIGMVDAVERVDKELKTRYAVEPTEPEPTPSND